MKIIALLFSPKGKIKRKEWWFILVGGYLFCLGLFFLVDVIFPSIIGGLLWIPFLWVYSLIHVKRYRDMGKSGWWTIVNLIPCGFNLLITIALGFFPSVDVKETQD